MKRIFLLLLFVGMIAFGDPASPPVDPDLPGGGFAPSHYETLWTKSPFAVASAETAATPSADYSLVGIAQFDGVSYASLIDKGSQEHFLVSSDKPARGLTLVSVTNGRTSSDITVVLQRNGESITLKPEQGAVLPTMAANAPAIPPPPSPYAVQPSPYPGAPGEVPGARPPIRRRFHIPIPPRPPVQQSAPAPNQPSPAPQTPP